MYGQCTILLQPQFCSQAGAGLLVPPTPTPRNPPAVPLCSASWSRCCQKLRKGAMPVPGPMRMQGWEGSSGSWKLLALEGTEGGTP